MITIIMDSQKVVDIETVIAILGAGVAEIVIVIIIRYKSYSKLNTYQTHNKERKNTNLLLTQKTGSYY